MSDQSPPSIPPIPKHKYPRWVLIFGVAVAAITLYSLTMLPNYASATKSFRLAQSAYRDHDFDAAASHYLQTLDRVPSSKVARIGAAMAVFSNSDKKDDPLGLQVLAGVTLSTGEWSDLKRVMPVDYQQYFEETK